MRTRWMPMMIAAAALSAMAANANANGRHDRHYVYAKVVDVEPIVRLVTVERPRRECWEETVAEVRPRPFGSAGATLAGAVVGGAIGRQFGSGDGRDAMTLIGTLAGAAVANERNSRRREAYTTTRGRLVPVERCEVVSERRTEERVDGYRVTYRYQGRHYTMRTAEIPPDRIRLRVDLRPVAY